jgi:hydrogenase maturation protease
MSTEPRRNRLADWNDTPWEQLERPGPDMVEVDGVAVRRGSRVRLRPRPGGDVFDVALKDRLAVVEAIEQDMEEQIQLAVVVEDDPGRDLGHQRQPGHRFFFAPAEVEPVGEAESAPPPAARVLVAGIGNVLLGDDGFGVALANRLAAGVLPAGIEVVDFGIRGMDLAWAIQDGYEVVILLDATPRGGPPGTLYLIEPEVEAGAHPIEGHGMDPATVLSLVHALGGTPPRTLVVGCEPQTRIDPGDENLVADLSEPVRLALDEGLKMVESVLAELTAPKQTQRSVP